MAGRARAAAEAPLLLTLDRAIALAMEHNRDLLIAARERDKAEAQVGEARAGALPQVNLSGQYTRNIQKPVMFLSPNTAFNPSSSTQTFELGSDNQYLLEARLSQPLLSRKVGLALEVARTYREYVDQARAGTTQDVVLSVKKAFYGALLAQRLVEVNRQGLELVQANRDNVRAQYEQGMVAEFDLLRAEVQLANTDPLLVQAENTLELAKNALKNLLGLDLEVAVEPQGEFAFAELSPEEIEAADRQALATNPLILQLALQEKMLEKNVGIEQANRFPSLSLVGAYQWQTQDNSLRLDRYQWAQTFNLGLQLSYPLFDGWRTRARVVQAMQERRKIGHVLLKAEEGLRIQIQSAQMKMAEAKKRIVGQGRNIEQAEKAVHIAQTRYQSGVGTQLELLDTQAAMTRAQTNYAQAIYDYLVAQADWERAVGRAHPPRG